MTVVPISTRPTPQAELIDVTAGSAAAGIDARMQPIRYRVFQVDAADRYAVAANASKATFGRGIPVGYGAGG
jgi:precorrin-6B methylase 2